MNFQQLRCVREIVQQNFNLTQAAHALFTSQPGVSKMVLDLENQLGFNVFLRHGKRIKGLTKEGEQIYPFIEKVLQNMADLKEKAAECRNPHIGRLTIATTHTQARYVLPAVMMAFRTRYPEVRLSLLQGAPSQIAQMVLSGQADIAVATESISDTQGLQATPCYTWQHQILLPKNHPLTQLPKMSIEQLARYPLVTYDPAFAGRTKIDRAFVNAQVTPDIVLEAIDADVIRTYVEVGMGIGILSGLALESMKDNLNTSNLTTINAGDLFGLNTTFVAVREDRFLREFEHVFIDLLIHKTPKLLS
ncbi:LysR substrate-binding domain-containing protein [Hydromonas duriensis]|uniref:LysR family transcriptional regulator n=1 Tax=Hydromonas duriensis TaxID=1527608 RepID=A0A4R6Y8G9_9BURK|nr:LysR substrate-binding domain-containing protein [Hydromonas duriensis]TDR31705.1 LysR family transcriptional regulator [Hydromonas duriensis]